MSKKMQVVSLSIAKWIIEKSIILRIQLFSKVLYMGMSPGSLLKLVFVIYTIRFAQLLYNISHNTRYTYTPEWQSNVNDLLILNIFHTIF